MRTAGAALRGWIALGLVGACAKGAGTPDSGASPATSTPTSTSTPSPTPTSTPSPTPTPLDAGPSSCRVLFGPKELPVRSAPALSLRGDTVEAVLDEDGKARVVSAPAGAFSSSTAGVREALEAGEAPGLSVPCAVAGDVVFCPDRGGNVHRTIRGSGEEKLAASARTGSRIAAGLLAGSHPTLAYLASRQTSEGWVNEAWLTVDEAPPVRVSEDGSGATAITLAPHGAGLMVLSVDARTALTAMHARVITYKDGLVLGEDSVLFVGGPGDRRTGPAIALGATGAGLGLLPIAKDVGDFGLALVRIDDPPRVDEPVVWSMYPNGLDPAPVAAAVGVRGGGTPVTWVARVRPAAADPSAPRLLEIGEVGASTEFAAHHVVAGTTGTIKDVSLLADGHGALWLAWLDGAGSWLERLACK